MCRMKLATKLSKNEFLFFYVSMRKYCREIYFSVTTKMNLSTDVIRERGSDGTIFT